jgi:hypothetical protein
VVLVPTTRANIPYAKASRGKVDRANDSEVEKGRPLFRKGAHPTAEERISIGKRLLEAKATLPHGHFGPWLCEKSGLGYDAARRYMAAARAA